MPLHLSWEQVCLRLALTVLASGLIGFDRGVRGHAAGLRTTLLVGLAASMAMIEANLLLPIDGKAQGSFATLDLMRLPLGILTGVGFIGGGAILKKPGGVSGLTTAATLWLTTVIGLCFGAGQNGLGLAGTALALATLFVLKRAEQALFRDRRARLALRAARELSPATVEEGLERLGCAARFKSRSEEGQGARLVFELTWKPRKNAPSPADLLSGIDDHYEVVSFRMISADPG